MKINAQSSKSPVKSSESFQPINI